MLGRLLAPNFGDFRALVGASKKTKQANFLTSDGKLVFGVAFATLDYEVKAAAIEMSMS